MDSTIAPDRRSGSVDSSSVLVSKGLCCDRFLPANTRSRGAYGLLVFVMSLITSEADLTVSSLRNTNYAGSVNYLWTIIENGKITGELTQAAEERYDKLLCASMEQLKLCNHPLAAGAPPSPYLYLCARAGCCSPR